MDQTAKESLKKAIKLLKEGNQKAAIPLLTGLLKKEPDLEQGWYLLGLALDAKDQKLRAFRQALKLNPDHEKAKQQIEKLEQPDLTFEPFPTYAQEEEPSIDEQAQPEQLSDFDSPFGEPADAGPVAAEPEKTMQPDFDLPEWMKQDTFNATDQLPPLPEADGDQETSAEDMLRAEEQAEIVETPDWAKAPGPLPLGPDLNKPVEEPQKTDQPDWMNSTSPFVEEEEKPDSQPAFTGYYDDEEDEEELHGEGEEDVEEGEPEWLRSMVEEEEGSEKQKRKKKEKKKKIKVELSPREKKQRRRRVFWLFLIVLFSGLGAYGYFYPEKIEPYKQMIVPPILTQIAPVTDLLTQGAPLTDLLTPRAPVSTPGPSPTLPQQPTLQPTWTPAQSNSANATLLPAQATEAAGTQAAPTTLPLPEDTMNEIQKIQEQVVALRQLPGPNSVENAIVPKATLRQVIEGWVMQEGVLEELQKDQILYTALGLVNSNYDLIEAAVNSRADAIGGFYHPEANQVYIAGTGFNAVEKYIYSHEYAHAVQDANFDLRSLGVYPTCTQAAQTCLAIQALVEGEASLLDALWFENYPPAEGQQDILNYQPQPTLFQGSPAPQFFTQNALFPYTYGLEFVSYLYDNGGWNAVNRAYRVLPATTEQIMHPVKYDQREAAMYLAHPDLNAVFDENWELIRNNSLGEWMNYLLLAYNDYPNAAQDEKDASIAAAGWGADQYQVYYNASTREVQMSVYWTWDTNIDSDEFYTLLNQYLNARFAGATTEGPGEGSCWAIRGQLTCTYINGKQILWLLGDDEEILAAVKQRFSYFP